MVNQDEMITAMVGVLRGLPDGTEITTWQLAKKAGFIISIYDASKLFPLHLAIIDAAEKAGIELDMSKHENLIEGLPFNLDYAVRHRK